MASSRQPPHVSITIRPERTYREQVVGYADYIKEHDTFRLSLDKPVTLGRRTHTTDYSMPGLVSEQKYNFEFPAISREHVKLEIVKNTDKDDTSTPYVVQAQVLDTKLGVKINNSVFTKFHTKILKAGKDYKVSIVPLPWDGAVSCPAYPKGLSFMLRCNAVTVPPTVSFAPMADIIPTKAVPQKELNVSLRPYAEIISPPKTGVDNANSWKHRAKWRLPSEQSLPFNDAMRFIGSISSHHEPGLEPVKSTKPGSTTDKTQEPNKGSANINAASSALIQAGIKKIVALASANTAKPTQEKSKDSNKINTAPRVPEQPVAKADTVSTAANIAKQNQESSKNIAKSDATARTGPSLTIDPGHVYKEAELRAHYTERLQAALRATAATLAENNRVRSRFTEANLEKDKPSANSALLEELARKQGELETLLREPRRGLVTRKAPPAATVVDLTSEDDEVQFCGEKPAAKTFSNDFGSESEYSEDEVHSEMDIEDESDMPEPELIEDSGSEPETAPAESSSPVGSKDLPPSNPPLKPAPTSTKPVDSAPEQVKCTNVPSVGLPPSPVPPYPSLTNSTADMMGMCGIGRGSTQRFGPMWGSHPNFDQSSNYPFGGQPYDVAGIPLQTRWQQYRPGSFHASHMPSSVLMQPITSHAQMPPSAFASQMQTPRAPVVPTNSAPPKTTTDAFKVTEKGFNNNDVEASRCALPTGVTQSRPNVQHGDLVNPTSGPTTVASSRIVQQPSSSTGIERSRSALPPVMTQPNTSSETESSTTEPSKEDRAESSKLGPGRLVLLAKVHASGLSKDRKEQLENLLRKGSAVTTTLSQLETSKSAEAKSYESAPAKEANSAESEDRSGKKSCNAISEPTAQISQEVSPAESHQAAIFSSPSPAWSPTSPHNGPTFGVFSPMSPHHSPYSPMSPNYRPSLPDYQPTSPDYSPSIARFTPAGPHYSPRSPEPLGQFAPNGVVPFGNSAFQTTSKATSVPASAPGQPRPLQSEPVSQGSINVTQEDSNSRTKERMSISSLTHPSDKEPIQVKHVEISKAPTTAAVDKTVPIGVTGKVAKPPAQITPQENAEADRLAEDFIERTDNLVDGDESYNPLNLKGLKGQDKWSDSSDDDEEPEASEMEEEPEASEIEEDDSVESPSIDDGIDISVSEEDGFVEDVHADCDCDVESEDEDISDDGYHAREIRDSEEDSADEESDDVGTIDYSDEDQLAWESASYDDELDESEDSQDVDASDEVSDEDPDMSSDQDVTININVTGQDSADAENNEDESDESEQSDESSSGEEYSSKGVTININVGGEDTSEEDSADDSNAKSADSNQSICGDEDSGEDEESNMAVDDRHAERLAAHNQALNEARRAWAKDVLASRVYAKIMEEPYNVVQSADESSSDEEEHEEHSCESEDVDEGSPSAEPPTNANVWQPRTLAARQSSNSEDMFRADRPCDDYPDMDFSYDHRCPTFDEPENGGYYDSPDEAEEEIECPLFVGPPPTQTGIYGLQDVIGVTNRPERHAWTSSDEWFGYYDAQHSYHEDPRERPFANFGEYWESVKSRAQPPVMDSNYLSSWPARHEVPLDRATAKRFFEELDRPENKVAYREAANQRAAEEAADKRPADKEEHPVERRPVDEVRTVRKRAAEEDERPAKKLALSPAKTTTTIAPITQPVTAAPIEPVMTEHRPSWRQRVAKYIREKTKPSRLIQCATGVGLGMFLAHTFVHNIDESVIQEARREFVQELAVKGLWDIAIKF